jgi:NADPH:quinone reductase-like Zn-dependent oxidoreductase
LTEPYRHVVPGRIRSTLGDVWGIQIDRQGGPDELIWRELPEPEPGSGEVVVELAAAGLNYIDVYHRSGLYPVVLPYVPGLEGAGTVVAVGDGVACRPSAIASVGPTLRGRMPSSS